MRLNSPSNTSRANSNRDRDRARPAANPISRRTQCARRVSRVLVPQILLSVFPAVSGSVYTFDKRKQQSIKWKNVRTRAASSAMLPERERLINDCVKRQAAPKKFERTFLPLP